jgi:hypothetical protein
MRYKALKVGNWCSVGIDEVRHEYVLENCEGFSSAPTYYSISEEEFNSFPWNLEDFIKYRSSKKFLCSQYLYGQDLEQLCRLYEKEIDENGSLLIIGNNTNIYRSNKNEFICIKISQKYLPYDIYGIGNQSILPSSLVERLLGPSYYALKEIKPTVKELIIDYIENSPEKFKIVNK